MDKSVLIAIIGLIGSIAGIIIANRYTARTAKKAQETTARLEERKLDASTWQQQYQGWKDDALKLRELREEDRVSYERDREEMMTQVRACRSETEGLREELSTLREELHALASESQRKEEQVEQLISWARIVVVLLRQANISYPPVPPGVSTGNTNPNGIPAQKLN